MVLSPSVWIMGTPNLHGSHCWSQRTIEVLLAPPETGTRPSQWCGLSLPLLQYCVQMGFLEKTLFQFQVGLSMYSDEDDDDDETPPTGLEETEVFISS